jgi:hypothetical protein
MIDIEMLKLKQKSRANAGTGKIISASMMITKIGAANALLLI